MNPNDIAKLIDGRQDYIYVIVDYNKKEFYVLDVDEANRKLQSIVPHGDPHYAQNYGDVDIIFGCPTQYGTCQILNGPQDARDTLGNYLILSLSDDDYDDDDDDNISNIIEHIINHKDGEINRHFWWAFVPKSHISNGGCPVEVYEFKYTSGNGDIGTTGKIVRVSRKKVVGLLMMQKDELDW